MKLGTINNWLRRTGLVLVVAVWNGKGQKSPIRLWVERWNSYQRRCREA